MLEIVDLPFPPRTLAVIVLYKVGPLECESFRTLSKAMKQLNSSDGALHILFYDNTPGGCDPGTLPNGVRYEAAQQNAGLAVAYNRALEVAEAEGFDWLLTLDQDTSLPEHFLTAVGEIAARIESDNSIAAIVPQLSDSGTLLSPTWWLWNAIPRPIPRGFTGISMRTSSAFNSASVVRVSAVRMIGGYNQRFWLDGSDNYLYSQLYKHGKRLYVAGNIMVEHQYSVLDMNQRVTISRYQNILSAGCAFWDIELGWLAGLDYTARLIWRTFYTHWTHGHDPAFRRASLQMLKKRLFQSRKHRIKEWKQKTEYWVS